MKDLMIDLETLGTTPECVVVSIGATFFDIEKKIIGPDFYVVLKIQDQLDKGRKIQADTLEWWFGQSNAAKSVFHEGSKLPIEVLNMLSTWLKANCSNSRDLRVWGNGSTFDISIMENIYRQYNLKLPWGYNAIMDLRTFRRFVAKNQKVENIGTSHNALDDAKSQAVFVIKHSHPPVPPNEF